MNVKNSGWTSKDGIKSNIENFIGSTVKFSKDTVKGVSQLMQNYEKINEAKARAKRDVEAGIVGYDKDGTVIIDVDLLDERKQAMIPEEVRIRERQEREMILMI